jgi:tetratricopeptide (TPR) repeat protein
MASQALACTEDASRRVLVRANHSGVLYELGRHDEAMLEARAAHADATREGLVGERLFISSHIARLLISQGRHAEALSRSLELYEAYVGKVDDPANAAANAIGFTYMYQGHLEEAATWFDRLVEPQGMRLARAMHGAACIAALREDWKACYATQLRTIAVVEDAQMGGRALENRCWAAVAAARSGEEHEAQRLLQTALSLLTPHSPIGDRALIALAHEALGLEGPPVPDDARWYAFCRIAARAFGVTPLEVE